jgi:MFS family permease
MSAMRNAPIAAKPQPPAAVRWGVLVFVSIAMFGNYYVYDSVAPLADILRTQLGFSSAQVGTLNAIYSFPNIVMVLIGGIIVDRIGTRTATLAFTAICLAGAILTATSGTFATMALGRLVFGLGAESMIVAVTAALGQWFQGRQLGFAFGLNLSIARAGSYAADLSPAWASGAYASGWREPMLIAVGFALVSFVGATVYWILERSAEPRYALGRPEPSDRIIWSDLWRFDLSYWYIVGLCVTFYSVIFPFRSTFAIEYFQNAHGLSLERAGQMNGYVFLAAIFATPLFGLIVDRIGHRSLAMIAGSVLLAAVFPTLLFTSWDLWVSTVLIGVAFSLVPAVLWPSVPYLVGQNRLGTAYGLMTMLQNIGLTVCNLAAGTLNDLGNAGAGNPAGYRPMLWMFAVLSLAALAFSALLRRREIGPHGHGLEAIRAGVDR